MKHFFKIFCISMLMTSYVVKAQEVVSVEGQYSYGPSISQNNACERATMNGKNEAIRRVSGESVSNDTIENCVDKDCKLYEKTWSSLGNNTVIKKISNFKKQIVEELGEKICKVTFDAEVVIIRKNINKVFYITTNFGNKKKIFKASSSKSAKDGDSLKMKVTLSEPAHLYVYGWYPEENTNQLVNVISYPQYGQVKKSYNFPPEGNETYFLISETNKKNSASEYLLLIASKQKIDLGMDIEFDDMKKLLYDIPTYNWTKKGISYTVIR